MRQPHTIVLMRDGAVLDKRTPEATGEAPADLAALVRAAGMGEGCYRLTVDDGPAINGCLTIDTPAPVAPAGFAGRRHGRRD